MISVIVCTYNRAHYLAENLEYLLNQTVTKYDFEIIVVDNNSTDNTAGICHDFSTHNSDFSFHYFLETVQGLSHARNRGIKEAKGDILTFIDDDAFAQSNFIQYIEKHFATYPQTAALGGKIIPKYEGETPRWMSRYLLPLVAALDMGDEIKSFKKGKFPIGANMSIRKSAFEEFGLFDTNLGRKGNLLEGSEEKDFFLRLTDAGKNIKYLPQAVVHHIIPAKRVSWSYIKKQAIGIGKSEGIRTLKKGNSTYIKFLFREFIKWVATIVLSLRYLLTLSPAKSLMLIRFRFYVTYGIFNH